MKTAIYIEDGTVQLVITPESEFEKNALRSFENKPTETKIMAGTFYGCQGGWIRHEDKGYSYPYEKEDRSLIIRIDNSKVQS